MAEQGSIEYTERAFAQDADQAMNNDVMRGLVELITNCDDAYGESEGDITVLRMLDAEGNASIAVCDNGPGLNPEGLKTCFSVLGGKSSGFHEGDDVRGLFGRGAKDTAAFGRTKFESIKNGTYGVLELKRSGEWKLDNDPASEEDFERLAIPKASSGLVATMYLEQNPGSLPSFTELVRKIGKHVQLRRVSQSRRITVRNVQAGQPKKSAIARWNPPGGEVLFDDAITIDGYETTAQLVIKKLRTPASEPLNPYASHGIEIRGSKAIYQITKFNLNGPEIKWVYVEVTCPKIDELIRQFEDESNDQITNPQPLIRRDRDGLVTDHPFTIALRNAVFGVLTPVLEELKPNTDEAVGGKKLKNDLNDVGKSLAALLEADLARIEDPDDIGGNRPVAGPPIQIIPPRVSFRLHKKRTMTILVDETKISDPNTLVVSCADTSIVAASEITPFKQHTTFEDTVIANFVIEALDLGRSTITVHTLDRLTSASAEVRISDEPPTEPEEPTELRWANAVMSVANGKERTIKLEAPIERSPSGALVCRVEIDGRGIELLDDKIELRLNANGWLSGKCRIKGAEIGSSTRIRALSGTEDALGTVRVTKPAGLEGLGLSVEIFDSKLADFRAVMKQTDTGHNITIHARHDGLSELIGKCNPDGSFENGEKIEVSVAMAEIIGSTITDWLLIREAEKSPAEFPDADALLARRNEILNKYTVAVQRLLTQNRG